MLTNIFQFLFKRRREQVAEPATGLFCLQIIRALQIYHRISCNKLTQSSPEYFFLIFFIFKYLPCLYNEGMSHSQFVETFILKYPRG